MRSFVVAFVRTPFVAQARSGYSADRIIHFASIVVVVKVGAGRRAPIGPVPAGLLGPTVPLDPTGPPNQAAFASSIVAVKSWPRSTDQKVVPFLCLNYILIKLQKLNSLFFDKKLSSPVI